MKHLILVCMVIAFVVGCNNIPEQKIEEERPITVFEILEQNKEEITCIKDKLADDLELGNAIRQMVVDEKMSNSSIGFFAREMVTQQEAKNTNAKNADQRSHPFVKWGIVITGVLFLIVMVILYFRGKNE